MQKIPLAEFTYNNNIYSIIEITLFFIIYRYYFNVPLTIADNRPEGKILAIKKAVQKVKSKNKLLAKQ